MRRIVMLAALALSGCATNTQRPGADAKDVAAARAVMLEGFIQKVEAKAREYAKKRGLRLLRTDVPIVKICQSEDELLAIREKDSDKANMVLCGLCDYKNRTIYALGMDYEVLAHEFGHWYFGSDEDRADDFAWSFCHEHEVKSLPILTR